MSNPQNTMKQAGDQARALMQQMTNEGATTAKAIKAALIAGWYASLRAEEAARRLDAMTQELSSLAGLTKALVGTGMHHKVIQAGDRRPMFFEGPHDPGRTYGAGDVVQRKGYVWVAMTATASTPGETSQWRRIGVDR